MADIITVAALNRYVKTLLDTDPVLTDIAVRGEIANFVHHRSGHLYFSLRDEKASVKAVMFRTYAQQLAFEPRDGMRVVLRCRVSLYEQTGSFQLYAEDMFPDGLGSVQMAFEQLKEKLEKEGLFDPARKKPIPRCPQCIGLVTSKTGAAIQDILTVSQRRWPLTRFLLSPVNVQGAEAADQVANAIRTLDASGRVDVILVARGGGSREDLWLFNSEKIARAVCACKKPVVSAIGHEIDFTILDFAADLRAATPSAAAELLCPDQQEFRVKICMIQENIHKNMQERLQLCYNELKQQCQLFTDLSSQMVDTRNDALSQQIQKLTEAAEQTVKLRENQLGQAAELISCLDPMSVLAHGYLMAQDEKKQVVTLEKIASGDTIWLEDAQRKAHCRVLEIGRKENKA